MILEKYTAVSSQSDTKMIRWYSILLLANIILANAETDYPKLKTPLGDIRGYYKTSENGRLYEAYEGVPYAFPPVGKLRFKVSLLD